MSAVQTSGAQPDPAQPVQKRPQVGILIHPKMILLDMAGPLTVFNILRSDVHLVWTDREPVMTDVGIPLTPTATFETCPGNLDVLFVPGGLEGTIAVMEDPAALEFLASRGAAARFVTSVCTGSLLLGAAGLLQGYRATSHWYVRDFLDLMGATVSHERVVIDRNRITGGGVTAGLDFGLELARQIAGEEMAKTIQLVLEYDPKPPFAAGSPEQADAALVGRVQQLRGAAIAAAKDAASRASQRLKF